MEIVLVEIMVDPWEFVVVMTVTTDDRGVEGIVDVLVDDVVIVDPRELVVV